MQNLRNVSFTQTQVSDAAKVIGGYLKYYRIVDNKTMTDPDIVADLVGEELKKKSTELLAEVSTKKGQCLNGFVRIKIR